jgi:hypothetical protein
MAFLLSPERIWSNSLPPLPPASLPQKNPQALQNKDKNTSFQNKDSKTRTQQKTFFHHFRSPEKKSPPYLQHLGSKNRWNKKIKFLWAVAYFNWMPPNDRCFASIFLPFPLGVLVATSVSTYVVPTWGSLVERNRDWQRTVNRTVLVLALVVAYRTYKLRYLSASLAFLF